jgi:hypothetical protein
LKHSPGFFRRHFGILGYALNEIYASMGSKQRGRFIAPLVLMPYWNIIQLVHIPKIRNGAGKIMANASTPDFSGASD